MKTVIEIVKAYLDENGFDGLYSPVECGCKKDDLAPCGSDFAMCEPGYLQECDCGDHDWHICQDKTPNAKSEPTSGMAAKVGSTDGLEG